MPREYPWYEVVTGDQLEQGDLLFRCPVFTPAPDLTLPLEGEGVRGEIREFDVVVMTQSCDLVQEKLSDVIICPHWDLAQASQTEPALATGRAAEDIRKGRQPRYSLLAPAPGSLGIQMGVRVVDFGRIFSLPKEFLRRFAATLGQRPRLCPPYREQLSQSFARFFMRVGLPQEIELLQSQGIDAVHAGEIGLASAADLQILISVREERRIPLPFQRKAKVARGFTYVQSVSVRPTPGP